MFTFFSHNLEYLHCGVPPASLSDECSRLNPPLTFLIGILVLCRIIVIILKDVPPESPDHVETVSRCMRTACCPDSISS